MLFCDKKGETKEKKKGKKGKKGLVPDKKDPAGFAKAGLVTLKMGKKKT